MSLYVDTVRNKVYFRHNGEQCKILDMDASNLLPCIGMHSIGEAVQIIEKDFWTHDPTLHVSCLYSTY